LYCQNELDDRYSFGVSINDFNSSNQNRMKRLTLNLLDNINNNYKEEIEKRKKQESLLIQQSRLASIGEMIENIAHHWR